MEERKENRGGARKGAGRKHDCPNDEKKKNVYITLCPDMYAKVKAYAASKGIRITDFFNMAASYFLKKDM